MATVRAIITDALTDIGAIGAGDPLESDDAQVALRYFQRQIDAWAAQQLTLSTQSRLAITWPSSTTSQTIGASGADITSARPMFINALNYVVSGSSPAVEVVIAPQDRDSFAANTIKALTSQYPLAYFYQTAIDSELGTITLWPVPNQQLTLYLYAPQAVTVPVDLDTVLLGPAGYQDAFVCDLATRLLNPFGVKDQAIVQLVMQRAGEAMSVMKRPNNQPSVLGVDAAIVPATGGAYNILSDSYSGYGR